MELVLMTMLLFTQDTRPAEPAATPNRFSHKLTSMCLLMGCKTRSWTNLS